MFACVPARPAFMMPTENLTKPVLYNDSYTLLTCVATGLPRPANITWYKDGTHISPDDPDFRTNLQPLTDQDFPYDLTEGMVSRLARNTTGHEDWGLEDIAKMSGVYTCQTSSLDLTNTSSTMTLTPLCK